MISKRIMFILFGFCLSLAPLWIAGAGELPPWDSEPLSAILRSLEGQEPGVFTSAEFDEGLWEVKVCRAAICQKLYVDPNSGMERRRRKADSTAESPPANAKPLSAIIQSMEERGLGTITEVEFDEGFWKVELRKDGRKFKLDVDSWTGDLRR